VNPEHRSCLPSNINASSEVICLDEETLAKIDQESSEAPKVDWVTPESLINMIYTSGSTGKPKGVLVKHRGMVNLITWHKKDYVVLPSSRASQLVGAGFDPVGLEVFPFLTGGARYIINTEGHLLLFTY